MKTSLILVLCVLLSCSTYSFAQTDYGLQAGLAFDGTSSLSELRNGLDQLSENPKSASGYFIGTYAEFNFLMLYLRPELQYAQYNRKLNESYYKTSKIELPISLGYKILPLLSLYAGPSLHYTFNQKSDLNLGDLKTNTTLGAHFGARAHLGPVGISLRYDRGLTDNEVKFLNAEKVVSGRLDTRPEVWYLGISFSLD